MNNVNIIPQPSHIELKSGEFYLTPEAKILFSESTRSVAEFLLPQTGHLDIDCPSSILNRRQSRR